MTKLLGLVLLTVALVPGTLHGPLKIVCGLLGLGLGIATVFVEPAADD